MPYPERDLANELLGLEVYFIPAVGEEYHVWVVRACIDAYGLFTRFATGNSNEDGSLYFDSIGGDGVSLAVGESAFAGVFAFEEDVLLETLERYTDIADLGRETSRSFKLMY